MRTPAGIAAPKEVAALWRMGWLDGPAIAAVCMRWLETDLDQGDAAIAAMAGEPDLLVSDIAADFERALQKLVSDIPQGDEAILITLRLHLAFALAGDDLIDGVSLLIQRFISMSERRLVHHPHRVHDRPEQLFAQQELGLEYVYGAYFAFDDIQHLSGQPKAYAKAHADCLKALRDDAQVLHDHLTQVLASPVAERV
jgi:hypothetical protein